MTAAARVLVRASRAPFERRGSLLVAAASVLAGEPVESPPGLAFVTAAALGRKEDLEQIGADLPASGRSQILAAAECLLARIDPVWAWDLERKLLGESEQLRWPGLGLDIASRLEASEARRLLGPKEKANPIFASQFRIESAARSRTTPDDFSLRDLSVAQANAFLAGVALADPARALKLVPEALSLYAPGDLRESFTLLATATIKAGLANRIAELARRRDFVSVQAVWTEVGAAAGALSRSETADLVEELAPRATDELDPGRELIAGMPLLMALAHAGLGEQAAGWALQWQVPPPVLIDHLFYAEAPAVIPLNGLLRFSEREWSHFYESRFCWWDEPGQSWTDALTVVAQCPWRPLPGSLADLVRA
jgi:hypothetical protein